MGFDDWYFKGGIEPAAPTEQVEVRVGSGGNGLSTIVSNGLTYTCVGGGGHHPSIPEGMKPAPKYAIDPWGGAPNFESNFTATELCEERRKQDVRRHQQMMAQNGYEEKYQRWRRECQENQPTNDTSERQRIMIEAYRRIEADTYAITGHRPAYIVHSQEALKALSETEIEQIKAKAFADGEAAMRARLGSDINAIADMAFDNGMAAQRAEDEYSDPKEPNPIHRAMSRMLHADERYENKAFMPGGLLARLGDQ